MDLWSKLELVRQFIGSLSGLLLPVLIIVLFFILTRAFPRLFKGSKKGAEEKRKAGSGDILDDFKKAVDKAAEELGSAEASGNIGGAPGRHHDVEVEKILDAAENDPEMGIIRLSGALEKELRILAASSARKSGKKISHARGPLKLMLEKKHLPGSVLRAVELYSELSDRIVRGKLPEKSPIVRQVLVSGLTLLNAIRLAQGVVRRVVHTGVDIFSDEECTNVIENLKGVIIKQAISENESMSKGIYPTSNPAYYKTGKKVTWEWNLENLSGKAFYIDPESGEKKVAWDSSAEFRGRLVDES